MTPQMLVIFAPPLALLACAAAMDLHRRRIPNWLCLTLVCSGLMQSFTGGATVLPMASLLGLLAGGALVLPQFALRAVGGGDVKLLAGLGAWMGPGGVFAVFLVTSVVGMLIVLTQSIINRRLGQLLQSSVLVMVNLAHVRQLGAEHTSATGMSTTSVGKRLPYAVPVLLAMVLVLLIGGGMR